MVPAARATAGAPAPLWRLAVRPRGTVLGVDPVPLIFLVVVVAAAAVLLPFLVRLQRAARQALEALRGMEAELQSLRAEQNPNGADEHLPPLQEPPRE